MKIINILHVEDEELDADIIKTNLNATENEHISYSITHVMSMKEAVQKIDHQSYDVILLDLHLLDVRGVDNVRCLYRENNSAPIIVLTGLDSQSCIDEVIKAGAQDCIAKGNCHSGALDRSIKAAIQRHASQTFNGNLDRFVESA